MAVQKKIPLRQCMGCNAHKPKKELLRVVHTPEGTVELDFTGKKIGPGRIYLPFCGVPEEGPEEPQAGLQPGHHHSPGSLRQYGKNAFRSRRA